MTDEDVVENPEPADDDAAKSSGRPLRLDQFLKLCGVAETGGRAKLMIQGGDVQVNGELETRRRRKLASGDVIEVFDTVLSVDDFFTSS